VVGNVYRIEATYRPSGDEAPLAGVATVVLVYPLLANDHGSHTMIRSRTGDGWKALETDDLPSIQQAGADIDELGYLTVAGQPSAPTTGTGTDEGGTPVATIAIVAGLIALAVVGAVLLLGPRWGSREPEQRRRARR
jgi:hypothetical protein